MRRLPPLSLLCLLLAPPTTTVGCGGDDAGIPSTDSPDSGTSGPGARPRPGDNADTGAATPPGPAADASDGPTPDADGPDAAPPAPDAPAPPPVEPPPAPGDFPEGCDQDRDGYASTSCSDGNGVRGTDCNDTDPDINPGQIEVCDFVDNNCDGRINGDIECRVYAHTANDVYLVDPFNNRADFVLSSSRTMFDFDTAPDGTLYALIGANLERYDAVGNRWEVVGSHGAGSGANGFAILTDDEGVATGDNEVFRVQLRDGATTRVAQLRGDNIRSSGDCVVNKDGTVYMTSIAAFGGSSDRLVIIETEGGRAGEVEVIGEIGAAGIYGLTFAHGYLFGFASNGRIFEIDPRTGRGVEVANPTGRNGRAGLAWYGAASTPAR